MGRPIVCMGNVERYYGDNAEFVAKYEAIAASGKCPFCAPNIENQLVGETTHWRVVVNQYPYKGSRLHLLLLPKRHIISLQEMSVEEWADLSGAISLAAAKYEFLAKGYGLAVRVGEVGGVTLYHLHLHLIAPEVGEKGPIPVSFGIG